MIPRRMIVKLTTIAWNYGAARRLDIFVVLGTTRYCGEKRNVCSAVLR